MEASMWQEQWCLDAQLPGSGKNGIAGTQPEMLMCLGAGKLASYTNSQMPTAVVWIWLECPQGFLCWQLIPGVRCTCRGWNAVNCGV